MRFTNHSHVPPTNLLLLSRHILANRGSLTWAHDGADEDHGVVLDLWSTSLVWQQLVEHWHQVGSNKVLLSSNWDAEKKWPCVTLMDVRKWSGFLQYVLQSRSSSKFSLRMRLIMQAKTLFCSLFILYSICPSMERWTRKEARFKLCLRINLKLDWTPLASPSYLLTCKL